MRRLAVGPASMKLEGRLVSTGAFVVNHYPGCACTLCAGWRKHEAFKRSRERTLAGLGTLGMCAALVLVWNVWAWHLAKPVPGYKKQFVKEQFAGYKMVHCITSTKSGFPTCFVTPGTQVLRTDTGSVSMLSFTGGLVGVQTGNGEPVTVYYQTQGEP